jgi:hypothetical protein
MKPARLSRAVLSAIEFLEARCLFSALTPGSTVLVFNASTSGGQPSHTDTLTLTNTGSSTLSLSGLSVVADPSVGTDQSADFHVTSGSLPSSLGAGASTQVTVNFTATVANSVESALLNISGGGSTLATIQLHGLGTNGFYGYDEPSLANILTAFDIPTNIGVSDPSNSQYPETPGASSQEVPLQRLVKAGTGPVTIQMLASFNSSAAPSVRFGYYTPGDITSTSELFTINQADAQTVNPVAQGATSFDPGSNEFGLYATFPGTSTPNNSVDVHYSEDSLNTLDPTHPRKLRFFPLENSDGSVVPNAYVVAGEDYNDPTYNSFVNFVGIIRNVMAAPGAPDGAVLGLTNLDAVPGSDTLAFNRIQNPNPNDPNNFVDTVHDTNTLQVINSGDQPLSITALTLSDTTNWQLVNPPSLPATVAPGGTLDISIKFIATTDPPHSANETNDYSPTNGVTAVQAGGVWTGTLTIASNDLANPTKSLPLAGYWQYESENENEPSLQTIVNSLYGYGTEISNIQEPQYPDFGTTPVYFGEEQASAYWAEADPTQQIMVRQLAAYHNQFDPSTPGFQPATSLFYFPKGSPGSISLLFKDQTGEAQSLLPTISGSSTNPAEATFNPTGNFGWNIDGEASDDSLNTTDINTYGRSGHAVRFYPAHDSQGNLIANTWFMVMDYENSQYDNSDFQDNVYIVTNMRPALQPAAPADLEAIAAANGVTLQWAPVSDNTLVGYNLYRSISPTGPWTALNTSHVTGDSFLDTSAPQGTTLYYGVASINTSGQARGSSVSIQTAASASQTLTSADVNATPAGSTTIVTAGSDYQVTGGGVDIGGSNADGFRYVYEQFTGNFDVSAQVPSITQSGAPNAKAGLMARESLDPGSPMVFSGVTPAQGYRFNYRTSEDATAVYNSVGSITFPNAYVRLTRQGDVFTAYSSPDGVNWTETGTVTLSLPTLLDVGMAVSAESTTQTITAEFVGFPPAVNSPPPPPPPSAGSIPPPIGLTASALSGSVSLQWTAETAAAGYNVLRSTSSSGGFTQLNSSLFTSPSYVDSAVAAGTTYYYQVVAVDGSGNVSSPAFASATVPNATKTLAFGGRTTAPYTDDSGHKVVLKISGPGTGQATFLNGDATPDSITFTGTTAASTFTITVTGGVTHVGTIAVTGSLGHLSASKTLLEGDLAVSGTLGTVQLAGANGGHTLTVGAGARITSLNLGNVADLSIVSTPVIAQLMASSWSVTSGADSVTAPAIADLTVAGAFAPSLNLTGTGNDLGTATIRALVSGGPWSLAGSAGALGAGSVDSSWSGAVAGSIASLNVRGKFAGNLAAAAIGNLHVGGDLTGTVRLTAGTPHDLRTLSVGGQINGGQVLAAGSIGSVSAAALSGANIFAGVSSSLNTLPASSSDFVADSTISSVVVTGRGHPFAVQGSSIAAESLGHVTFGPVNTDNAGLPFGLAAHSLQSYTRRINGKVLTWTSRMNPALLTPVGDAVVRLV